MGKKTKKLKQISNKENAEKANNVTKKIEKKKEPKKSTEVKATQSSLIPQISKTLLLLSLLAIVLGVLFTYVVEVEPPKTHQPFFRIISPEDGLLEERLSNEFHPRSDDKQLKEDHKKEDASEDRKTQLNEDEIFEENIELKLNLEDIQKENLKRQMLEEDDNENKEDDLNLDLDSNLELSDTLVKDQLNQMINDDFNVELDKFDSEQKAKNEKLPTDLLEESASMNSNVNDEESQTRTDVFEETLKKEDHEINEEDAENIVMNNEEEPSTASFVDELPSHEEQIENDVSSINDVENNQDDESIKGFDVPKIENETSLVAEKQAVDSILSSPPSDEINDLLDEANNNKTNINDQNVVYENKQVLLQSESFNDKITTKEENKNEDKNDIDDLDSEIDTDDENNNDENRIVKSNMNQEDGELIKSEEDGESIKSEEDGESIKSEEDGELIKSEEDGESIKSEEDGESIKSEEDGESIKSEEDGELIKSEEDGESIKSEEDGELIKSEEDGESIKSETVKQEFNENQEKIINAISLETESDDSDKAVSIQENSSSLKTNDGREYDDVNSDKNKKSEAQNDLIEKNILEEKNKSRTETNKTSPFFQIQNITRNETGVSKVKAIESNNVKELDGNINEKTEDNDEKMTTSEDDNNVQRSEEAQDSWDKITEIDDLKEIEDQTQILEKPADKTFDKSKEKLKDNNDLEKADEISEETNKNRAIEEVEKILSSSTDSLQNFSTGIDQNQVSPEEKSFQPAIVVTRSVTTKQKDENMDLVYDKLEENEREYDDEEEEEGHEDSSSKMVEKTYHVIEKKVKIIQDSQFSVVSDGVKKHILREGSGTLPQTGDKVTLHCVGFIDRIPPKKFWNTKELGQRPFSFQVGEKQVIKGWDQAAASMKLYERSKFKIEAIKAYGKFGFAAWEYPFYFCIVFF